MTCLVSEYISGPAAIQLYKGLHIPNCPDLAVRHMASCCACTQYQTFLPSATCVTVQHVFKGTIKMDFLTVVWYLGWIYTKQQNEVYLFRLQADELVFWFWVLLFFNPSHFREANSMLAYWGVSEAFGCCAGYLFAGTIELERSIQKCDLPPAFWSGIVLLPCCAVGPGQAYFRESGWNWVWWLIFLFNSALVMSVHYVVRCCGMSWFLIYQKVHSDDCKDESPTGVLVLLKCMEVVHWVREKMLHSSLYYGKS